MIREPKNQSKADIIQFKMIEKIFNSSAGSFSEKIDAFPKFASRQSMAKFLARYEIFKKILHVNGSIIECGVLHGGGLFTWAKLSSIFEPSNHVRKIIGFDTFEGFPSINKKEKELGTSSHFTKGALRGSSLKEINQAVNLYDLNRPISHIPKIELIQGDIIKTAPEYLKKNPHLVVSLLYLDLDLLDPTKVSLETFLPRMPKGSIIVFDQLNTKIFPGETIAADQVIGISNLKIERFPFDSYISYSVL